MIRSFASSAFAKPACSLCDLLPVIISIGHIYRYETRDSILELTQIKCNHYVVVTQHR